MIIGASVPEILEKKMPFTVAGRTRTDGRVRPPIDLVRLSPWCFSRGRRVMDVAGTLLVLVPALPLMLVIALLVKAVSRGPVFFRHRRLGRDGVPFKLLKFRTMYHRPEAPGIALTCSGDPRVTLMGRLLRRSKLDELPQFFNVLRGDMSLVGPRPDTPEYYAHLSESQRIVLRLRPGITSAATLRFRNEEQVLARFPADQMEEKYVSDLLPEKIGLELDYARSATLLGDLKLLIRTVIAVLQ